MFFFKQCTDLEMYDTSVVMNWKPQFKQNIFYIPYMYCKYESSSKRSVYIGFGCLTYMDIQFKNRVDGPDHFNIFITFKNLRQTQDVQIKRNV